MKGPKVGLYLRLSREDDGGRESQSIENQRLLLTKFLAERGWEARDIYIDDGWSGVRFDRPAFQRLLEDIARGAIDTVITKDLSRLGRNYAKVGELLEEYFPAHGVRYLSASEGYDSAHEGGMGDLTPFLSVFNDMYARDISKKVRAALSARKQEGKFIGSQPPFGYRRAPDEKGRLVPDPETMEDVRRVFESYLSCGSVSGTAKYLTAQGMPTPAQRRGRRGGSGVWSAQMVRRILDNPTYAGHLTQNRVRTLSYKVRTRLAIPRAQWIVVKNTHEPLIDHQTFDRVQEMLRTRSYHMQSAVPHVLTGLAFCADCGASMTYVRSGARVYMVCQGYRRNTQSCTAHRVREDAVLDEIAGALRQMAAGCIMDWNALISAADDGARRARQRLAQAQAREEASQTALFRLYEDHAAGKLHEGEYAALYERGHAAWRQAQAEAEQAKRDLCSSAEPEGLHTLAADVLGFAQIDRTAAVLLLERVCILEERGVEIAFRFERPS